jgi:hypothetical protein
MHRNFVCVCLKARELPWRLALLTANKTRRRHENLQHTGSNWKKDVTKVEMSVLAWMRAFP